MPSIGAALIVRDEERCLARCLGSLRQVVDEIVVVDTGSLDASVQIAQDFGARVLHHPWNGDFSAARNVGLDAITSDLVLYVDADEYLAPVDRDVVFAQISDRFVAYRLRLRARPGFTAYREYRMWLNRPEIRFTGVIHESVVPAIGRLADDEGLDIGMIDLLLEHDGYEGDQTHKHARNLPLLLEQVENDPNRTYLWDHIGRIRNEIGDISDARAAFLRGIELVRRNGVTDAADSLVFADLIFSNALAETPDAELVGEAIRLFPDDPLIYWCGALDALSRGAYAEVCEHIEVVLATTEEQMASLGLGLNQHVLTDWASHVRATARFQLGDFAGAAADFAAAEAAAPEVLAYRAKRITAEALARQRPSR